MIKLKDLLNEVDERWTRWVNSMVSTVEESLTEDNLQYTDEYYAYDLIKTNFKADAPSDDMFQKACKEAIFILKKQGIVK